MNSNKRQTSQINTKQASMISLESSMLLLPSKSTSSYMNLSDSLRKSRQSYENVTYLEKTFDNVPVICFYCDVIFENLIKFECHVFLYKHIGPPAATLKYRKDWVECRKCQMQLSFNEQNTVHKCHKRLEEEITLLYRNMNITGIPLYCILCEARPIFSRSLLIIHLIANHSENIYRNKCAICNCLFRTESIYTKEEHMISEHLGEMEINLIKLNRLQEDKLVTVNMFLKPMKCIFKIDKLKICGEKFSDLAQFTLHILLYHCHNFKPNSIFKQRTKIIQAASRVNCKRCPMSFSNDSELQAHVVEYHEVVYDKHLEYLISHGGFEFKYDPINTCVLCMRGFPNHIAKTVHTYVMHWSRKWYQCGLCFEDIIDEKNLDMNDNLQYKFLRIHEKMHIIAVNHFLKLKEAGSELLSTFKISLVELPKLYVGTYTPMKILEQQEQERLLRKRIFPKEIKYHFVQLGNKNRKVQEALEIFG